ncbi:MAG: CAP domain-containing protein [Hyphomicrobiaceae bacterium]|nr:CAP domain-containing protein [Hyphomicrobiaceae bacterium]
MSLSWSSWLVFGALLVYGLTFIAPANAQGAPASAFERQVFQLTNQARARGAVCGGIRRPPAPPLIWNSGLGRAARQWSRHQASTGRLSHNRMRQRIQAVQLKACGKRLNWGENVAYNASPQRVVQRWLRSASHCKNIMNPMFRMVGVGMVQKGKRQYYTQLFHSSPGC